MRSANGVGVTPDGKIMAISSHGSGIQMLDWIPGWDPGGGVSKLYPWGNTPEPNAELAVFDCNGDALKCTSCAECTTVSGILPAVGSRPAGAAPWGQLDMAGSLEEWVFDGAAPAPSSCRDCAWLDDAEGRVFRGGGYTSPASSLSVSTRNGWPGRNRMHLIGLRCARDRR